MKTLTINNLMGVLALAALSGCSASDISTANVNFGDPPTPKQLQINRYFGIVETIPAQGDKIEVKLLGPSKFDPKITQNGANVLIEGNISSVKRINCYQENGKKFWKIDGQQYSEADLPHLQIALPKDKSLGIWASSLDGKFGDVQSASVSQSGCGDISIGNIANDLDANIAGSGNIRAGDVGGMLTANIGGAGDISIGAVKGTADLNIAGSGDIKMAQQNGPLSANIAGSGDIKIAAGGGDLDASIAGSGEIRHAGFVNNPSISILGSGDVIVHELRGKPSVSKLGSGGFTVK